MKPSSATLAAACLTAGLVTAFADAPAHAVVLAGPLTTSTGVQLYDGAFLNGSTVQDFPIATSPQTPPPGSDPVGILVFSQAAGASSLVGQTFDSAFLNGSIYTESDLIGYVENQAKPTQAELGAYYQFLASFGYGADPLTTSTSTNTGPIQAYLFSNGTSVGTLDPASLGLNPNGYTSGFGLASEAKPLTPPVAVPEPGSLPLLLLGGAALTGMTVKRRRRTL